MAALETPKYKTRKKHIITAVIIDGIIPPKIEDRIMDMVRKSVTIVLVICTPNDINKIPKKPQHTPINTFKDIEECLNIFLSLMKL
jgi:hypothetical protein